MFHSTVLCIPRSEAIRCAEDCLSKAGLHITRKAAPDVVHVLLPVPSFPSGDGYLAHILSDLPDNVIISGGSLSSLLLKNYPVVDFLQDPYYLAENAAITASCALEIVTSHLTAPITGKQVLLIGWGRIGKCLWHLLETCGADITIAARKDADRAMIQALGSRSITIDDAAKNSRHYDVIINTVPVMILPDIAAKENAVILELASKPGMSGKNIIDGRGLPGKMAPERSGALIAKTFLRLSLEKEKL